MHRGIDLLSSRPPKKKKINFHKFFRTQMYELIMRVVDNATTLKAFYFINFILTLISNTSTFHVIYVSDCNLTQEAVTQNVIDI